MITLLACPPDRLRGVMVRAEGVEPPHLSILEPKSSASTSSATRARLRKEAAYSKDGRLGKARQPLPRPFVGLPEES